MVSQTYVVGTARPTLYSVCLGFVLCHSYCVLGSEGRMFAPKCLRLYNSLKLSKPEIIQLTHRLCGACMTFSGMATGL